VVNYLILRRNRSDPSRNNGPVASKNSVIA
jgi:hypothetical protein